MSMCVCVYVCVPLVFLTWIVASTGVEKSASSVSDNSEPEVLAAPPRGSGAAMLVRAAAGRDLRGVRSDDDAAAAGGRFFTEPLRKGSISQSIDQVREASE